MKQRSKALERTLYSTGWYGRPGKLSTGKVHVVTRDTRTLLCKAKVHPDAQFQWCAAGIKDEYVDCGNCNRLIPNLRKALEAVL